jgi:hypothetical protein
VVANRLRRRRHDRRTGRSPTRRPDGYTVLFANSGHAILGAINKNLSFDPIGDFAGVTLVGEAPGIVVVPPSLGVFESQGVRRARQVEAGHDQLRLRGIGTSTHLAGAYFALKTGIDIVHVPYTVSRDDHRGPARRAHPGFVRAAGLRAAAACRTAGCARSRSAPRNR